MKTAPIVAATVDFSGAVPRSPQFDDLYHPHEGAFEQARDIFLTGNGLPDRWRGRRQFTILETGFGLGNNFLATWAAWRADQKRCERLHFVSLEKHPLARDDLARALSQSSQPDLARQLIDAWPPHTANLHSLEFESNRLRLLLAFGDAERLARELVANVDAFFLDGFSPARNDGMWSAPLFAALARIAAPGATAATWSAARVVREGLAAAGFEVIAAHSPGRKRDITQARYAPRFVPPRPAGRVVPVSRPSRAVIVGAGLAGAASARALAARGIECLVLDRDAQPAMQASGNPAGLFHGTVGIDDGPHARFHRASCQMAARWVREALAAGVPGATDGLLRLNVAQDMAAMDALVRAQALPSDYVQALNADAASSIAGLPLAHPAWLFSLGGWVDPGALVRHTLARPGIEWRGGCDVRAIQQLDNGHWRVLDGNGHRIAEAPILVLASADEAQRLAGLPQAWAASSRGQLSWLDAADVIAPLPRVPVASGGYALGLPDGRLVMGATQRFNDAEPSLRTTDHDNNLVSAQALLGRAVMRDGATLHGRVGWRLATRDRLPLAGMAPDLAAPLPARRDAPRLVPRRAGLFIHCALGSRGLTTAALCGELIAAQAAGAPWPLEADLVDAVDPARLALRQA